MNLLETGVDRVKMLGIFSKWIFIRKFFKKNCTDGVTIKKNTQKNGFSGIIFRRSFLFLSFYTASAKCRRSNLSCPEPVDFIHFPVGSIIPFSSRRWSSHQANIVNAPKVNIPLSPDKYSNARDDLGTVKVLNLSQKLLKALCAIAGGHTLAVVSRKYRHNIRLLQLRSAKTRE